MFNFSKASPPQQKTAALEEDPHVTTEPLKITRTKGGGGRLLCDHSCVSAQIVQVSPYICCPWHMKAVLVFIPQTHPTQFFTLIQQGDTVFLLINNDSPPIAMPSSPPRFLDLIKKQVSPSSPAWHTRNDVLELMDNQRHQKTVGNIETLTTQRRDCGPRRREKS